MTPIARQRLASELVPLTVAMARSTATVAQLAAFYKIVDRVMVLPAHEEVDIWSQVDEQLTGEGAGDAAAWLLEELAVTAVLLSCDQGPRAPEASSVLFAIPIVMGAYDSLTLSGAHEHLEAMQRVLLEAEVVDPRARVGLANRVLSTVDLMSRSPGELRRLNEALAEQVQAGEPMVLLPDFFDAEPPHGANLAEGVRLHYLVGVAIIADDYIEEVFPDLNGEPPTPAARQSKLFVPQAGITEAGVPWEDEFLAAFDACFSTVEGALTVVAPQGLYDDLKTGGEAAREMAFTLSVSTEIPQEAHPQLQAAIAPLVSEGVQEGFSVQLHWGLLEDTRPAMEWWVLPHEQPSDALAMLYICLEDAGIAVQPASGVPAHAPPASYLVH